MFADIRSGYKYCYLTLIILLKHYSFICTKLNGSKYFYVISIIQLRHTLKEFQVLLLNTNNSIKHKSFVCTQFKCQTVLSGATTPGQSGPGSNSNEGVFHISRSSRTEASSLDCLMSSTGYSLNSLTCLQRSSQCILQPQPTGLESL